MCTHNVPFERIVFFQLTTEQVSRIVESIASTIRNVHTHDVLANHAISFFFSYIPNQKDEIESRQNCRHEIDIFRSTLEIIVTTKYGIGSC
jgi:hypothetical protein